MLIFENAKIKIEIEQFDEVTFELKINDKFVTTLYDWAVKDIIHNLHKLIHYTSIQELVKQWIDKQGHDRCWYYPEIFKAIAEKLEIRQGLPSELPPQEEFDKGCKRYQLEEYKK